MECAIEGADHPDLKARILQVLLCMLEQKWSGEGEGQGKVKESLESAA